MSKNSITNWLDAKVEDKYSKKGELEHILELPDTHIGSTEFEHYNIWVPSESEDGEVHFQKQDIEFTPGLYKIIDEILVNAYDQTVRLKETAKHILGKETLTESDMEDIDIDFVKTIKIDIDKVEGYISVMNDGEGVDVAIHKEHNVYAPQLIFGDMRTSSNYNKNETGIKIVGGRNGFGAKLANIFSKKFIVETIDGRRKKYFRQEYRDNMNTRDEPEVTATTKKPFTKITFYPDLERFGYENGIDDNLYQLILKRAYDLAACTDANINVYINGKKIDCKTFEKYVNFYIGDKTTYPRVYKQFSERWEVVACASPNQKFEQVSFANGISTIRGGKHVEDVSNQIIKKLKTYIQAKKKIKTLKSEHVKDNIMVFVKCSIDGAGFDTQTKECLTTSPKKFGSKCEIDDAFIEALATKCGVMDQVFAWHELKLEINLKKTDSSNRKSHLNIPKLDDAEWAGGGRKAQQACLILTEGDSAKTLALAGRSAVKNENGEPIGHKMFGVFPLRGKVMNVDGANAEKIMGNAEITHMKQILGLKEGEEYKNAKKLRYGSIMIMTDQDSVTGDTPLLLKDKLFKKNITLLSIEHLCEYGHFVEQLNGKEYNVSNNHKHYQLWTESGWTNIENIMRHKVNKRIYRVITPSGIVDVTEDHSLLNQHGHKITPKQCTIGQELLHSFIFNDINNINVDIDEFPALEELSNLYHDYLLNQNIQLPNQEIIASIILSTSKINQESFIKTILHKDKNEDITNYKTTLKVLNKISAQFLYTIFKMNNYQTYLDYDEQTQEYLINIGYPPSPNYKYDTSIIKIIDLGTTEQYVYDLETENHHFQAGIGQMIVHNTDGSHIKGLLINLFKTKWPSLLEIDGFITSLLTPVIKITKGKTVKSFYSIPQFDKWLETNNNGKGWGKPKYYKGLATSTPKEGREYFEEFRQNIYTSQNIDETNNIIGLAFDKKRSDDRKEWLKTYDRDETLDYSQSHVSYKDFIDKDLKHFSHQDNRRSIPNMADGLKESQRKIMYAFMKKGKIDKTGIKVAQMAGYIGEHTAYHHGEVSLQGTMIGLAQNYIGSNNINILSPLGQFGSRLLGGKDSGAARYIFTRLEDISEIIFNKLDNPLYNYLDDDGQTIEPEYYVPIIPMILVNGAKGIGTGYSTSIPSYDPLDVIKSIRKLIAGEDIEDLIPWYRGFKGHIIKVGPTTYLTKGVYKFIDSKTVEISELPIGSWTQPYKEMLLNLSGEKLEIKSKKKVSNDIPKEVSKKEASKHIPKLLKRIDEAHTDTTVKFILHFEDEVLEKILDGPPDKRGINLFEKTFKLTSSISVNNMILYDRNHTLKKYKDTTEITEDFYLLRQELYVRRRKYMLSELKKRKMLLTWKAAFIVAVNSDDENENIKVRNVPKKDVYKQLEQRNFPKQINGDLIKLKDIVEITDDDANKAYDYLMSMAIYSLTQEKVEELKKEQGEVESQYDILKDKTHLDLWLADLDKLEESYKIFDKNYWKSLGKDVEQEYTTSVAMKKKNSKKFKMKAKIDDVISDEE